MTAIRVEGFRAEMMAEATRMLARAFVTNPLHVRVFGPSQLGKNEAFFRVVLAVLKGPKLVATDGSRILGLVHWVQSPHCQFSTIEKLRLTPTLVKGLGVGSALKMVSWSSVWSRCDPSRSHSHLGPIGVIPEAQGRHIGYLLMEHYCEQLDQAGDSGYLETDRPENVGFYRRFAFETIRETPVQGVMNYLMWRKAKPGDAPTR